MPIINFFLERGTTPPRDSLNIQYSRTSRVQRCLNYDGLLESEDDNESPASLSDHQSSSVAGQFSAEKLDSFTSLPTDHLNKLSLISCDTGFRPRYSPPSR